MITLVLGGTRSGKSSFAEQIAWHRGQNEVVYVATAEVKDEEMTRRVKAHKEQRPDKWTTIEEPLVVAEALKTQKKKQVVLLDCVTVLMSNLYYNQKDEPVEEKEKRVLARMKDMIQVAQKKELDLILVSSEVGLGIVPAYEAGREYRDLAGRVNQYLARQAKEVYFVCAGLPVEIKAQGLKNLQQFGGDDGDGLKEVDADVSGDMHGGDEIDGSDDGDDINGLAREDDLDGIS
ncbi:MAG: bifunctional adenosylcobinamide kinase/adenosylcobinamide-phosphate guanylyltransferase [Bacillota bacterium]